MVHLMAPGVLTLTRKTEYRTCRVPGVLRHTRALPYPTLRTLTWLIFYFFRRRPQQLSVFHLVAFRQVYPVVTDSSGEVLSLPPVINSHVSRIQLETTDVFIECTATDLTKANVVLDTVVAMFSQVNEVGGRGGGRGRNTPGIGGNHC